MSLLFYLVLPVVALISAITVFFETFPRMPAIAIAIIVVHMFLGSIVLIYAWSRHQRFRKHLDNPSHPPAHSPGFPRG